MNRDAGLRGREFESVCKWFLENAPVYRAELKAVWLWDEWPGRWGADAGIDLVAEDRLGRLWAIQAKAYAPENSITKADIDTFLSESSRPQFSFRLLIATTDRIGANARRTLEAQEKPASLVLLGDLNSVSVEWPSSPESLQPTGRDPKRPRPHQARAIADVISGLASVDRGRLVMACGSGKTLVSLFVAEQLPAHRVLVLVPSLSLLSQTLEEWTANSSRSIEFLPVCSDDTVADSDAPVATTSDLGFPVTTDPTDIAAFLRAPGGDMRVVFSTYQSSPRVAEAMALADVPTFDLVIADEAHRCAGRVSSDFATVLDAEAIRADRRLFMTATPRYFTGRVIRESKEADFEVASMDDETRFGPLLHRLSFAQAIEQELLTDYQVAIIGVDDDMYRQWAENGRYITTDGIEVTDARTLAAQIGVAKAIKSFDLRRTITFHSRVAAARRFSIELPDVIRWMPDTQRPSGSVECAYISGAMSAGERRRRLSQLRNLEGDRALIANAKCLTEGIDVPTLDAVAFIDPRRSEVDIVQAVGRAIRRAPDKKIGTIVLPVFIGNTDDPATALDDSSFKPVWDVLNALRAHDEELAESLDMVRRQLGQRPGTTTALPPKITIDLPARISTEFAAALRIRLVERSTRNWEYWYGLLLAYVEREGHARVPNDHVEGGGRLGGWVSHQRPARETMDPERRSLLEALPRWSWQPLTSRWDEAFALLTSFVEREGHAVVPTTHIEEGFKLGKWVTTQRAGRGRMSEKRRHRLEDLPGWTWGNEKLSWDEAFAKLKQYTIREGHARPRVNHVEDGFNLGSWVLVQRRTRDRMDADRIVRLKRLDGWTWDVLADRWDDAYAYLVQYTHRERDSLVPRTHVEDGFALGRWVGKQRQRRDRMEPDRRSRLEALPGWEWKVIDNRWEEAFALLVQYVDREGHARVPATHVENGLKLGRWVIKQRTKQHQMDAHLAARLEALPRWSWETFSDRWEEAFAFLVQYVDREGHARVPRPHVEDGFALGHWVGKQRSARGRMDADRRSRLESLPGWTFALREAQWEDTFAVLQQYVGREGHAEVPWDHVEAGYRLGGWVATQRMARNQMDSDRRARLEALPGWVW